MCCLFGLIDYRGTLTAKQKTRLIRELSIAAEVRGTDATGHCLQHRTWSTDLQAPHSGTSAATEHTEQCKGHHGSHTDGNAGQSQEE